MEFNEPAPPEPEPEPAQSVGATEQALRRLEQRLNAASAAAERLIADAARAAAPRNRTPPPAGWQAPDPGGATRPGGDVETIVQVVQSLRELIPPDLQRRLAEALREVLLAVRALIDWYLDRLEHARKKPVEVQDIPII